LIPSNGGANDDDDMPNNCSPMPVASPLQMTGENLEENCDDLSQNREEPGGDCMPEIANPTITDPEVDLL
jgi:hypothetical protein